MYRQNGIRLYISQTKLDPSIYLTGKMESVYISHRQNWIRLYISQTKWNPSIYLTDKTGSVYISHRQNGIRLYISHVKWNPSWLLNRAVHILYPVFFSNSACMATILLGQVQIICALIVLIWSCNVTCLNYLIPLTLASVHAAYFEIVYIPAFTYHTHIQYILLPRITNPNPNPNPKPKPNPNPNPKP